jgi:hypothetical protein
MDEPVDQVVGNMGITRPVCRTSRGIILDFLATEGPADTVKVLVERQPGAAEAAAAAHEEGGSTRFGTGGGLMAQAAG